MYELLVSSPLYVLLFGIAFWFVLALAGAKSLLAMERIEPRRVQESEARSILADLLSQGFVEPQWLDEHSYEPIGVFQHGLTHLAVWQRNHERTYLGIYLAPRGKRLADIETIFEHGGGLVTCTSSEVQLLPSPPGHWKQSFSVHCVAGLHRHHEEGLQFLTEVTGARPSRERIAVEDEIISTTREKCRFARSFPLWFLRIPYWYFIRCPRMHGKSIRQQHKSQDPALLTAR